MTNPHKPITPDGETIRFPDGSELQLEPGDRAKYDRCPCGCGKKPLEDWERAIQEQEGVWLEPQCTCPPFQAEHNEDCPVWAKSPEALREQRESSERTIEELREQLYNPTVGPHWAPYVRKSGRSIPERYEPKTKPMRIRVMDLPGEINPETHELSSPFVMVFDRVPKDDLAPLKEDLSERRDGENARDAVGARAFLFFSHEVQIGEDE
jgi:hypothetical protein